MTASDRKGSALAGTTDIELQKEMGRGSNRSFAPRYSGAVGKNDTYLNIKSTQVIY